MVDCDFCGKVIPSGTGKMFVKKDGAVINFCSSKCEKSMNNRRFKARITPWTKEFAQIKKMRKEKQQ
ncbi:MAG: 50S ribosomal protein L24e [Candidatus Woesearchaeota archaeon]